MEWARLWQAVDKIVCSNSLTETRRARRRLHSDFDVQEVWQLKAGSTKDITGNGQDLAQQVLAAGRVDEIQPIICPVVLGGGKRFYSED